MVYARYNMTHHSMEDTIICQNFSEYSGNSPASIPSKRGLFDSNATNPQGYSTKYHMNISDSSNIKTMTDFSVLVLANVTATPTLTDLSILASSSCDSNRGGCTGDNLGWYVGVYSREDTTNMGVDFLYNGDTVTHYQNDTTTTTTINSWNLWTFIHDNLNSKNSIYINRTKEYEFSSVGDPVINDIPFEIGNTNQFKGEVAPGGDYTFDGLISYVIVWNGTIPQSVINRLVNNTDFTNPAELFLVRESTVQSPHAAFSSFTNNASTVSHNGDSVEFTIDIQNATGYILSWNDTGVFENDSFVPLNSNGTVTVTKSITATKGAEIYALFYANNSDGVTNQSGFSQFTVANAPPPQVTGWVFPETDFDHDNYNITFNWSDVTDIDGDSVTYQFYINLSTSGPEIVSDSVDSNWTANFANDTDYKYIAGTFDGEGYGLNSTPRIFTLDTTNPIIHWNYPSADNTTISNKNLSLDIECSDVNLFEMAVDVTNSSDDSIFSTFLNTTTETILTVTDTVTLTIEDTYRVNVTCSDQHTAKIIPDYNTEKDIANDKLSYDTGDNLISISLKTSAVGIDDFSTTKLTDRYTFSYDFSSTLEDATKRTFVFVLAAQHPLIYLPNSQYNSHFISNRNWIDFDLNDGDAIYDITKINDNLYEIAITTSKTKLDFNSIGGLNIKEEHANYTFETTPPGYVNNAANGTDLTKTGEDVHFNVTWSDSNPGEVIFCFGDGVACTNESLGNYTSGQNFTVSKTITAAHNQVVSWQFFANDTAGNVNNTPLATFTVANTIPSAPTLVEYVSPVTAFSDSLLVCNASGSTDADNETITFNYEFRDTGDSAILQNFSNLSTFDCATPGCDKGDTISCHAKASDGFDFSAEGPVANITIQNAIPNQTFPLLNSSSGTNFTNENLTCHNQSTFDADNDNVANIYAWYKNNLPLNDLYLPFEININDFSGNANNGVQSGGEFVNGVLGKGLQFNGANEFINISDDASLDFTNKKSWEIWFKRDALGEETVFDKTNSNDNLTNYKLYLDSSNNLIFTYSISGVAAGNAIFETLAKTGFDEGTYDDTEFNTTSNAVQLSFSKSTGNYSSNIADAGAVSAWNNISWTEELPYGEELPDDKGTDEGEYMNKTSMSGNVLLMHMNEASGTTIVDSSGSGNNGTYNGALLSQNGKLSTSIGFDGADDSIQIPSSSGDELDITSDLTVSAWLKWKGPSDPPDIYYPRILEKSYQTSYMFSLRPDDATRLSVWIENGERASTPSGSLSLNEWHHAAFTFDDAANTVKIYIDGIQQGSGSYTGSITGSSNDVYIGRYPQSAVAFWNGTMDEVAVWNRSLTAGEILDIYKRGALRLNLSVRSCDDSSCDTEQFADITDISPQDLAITDNQYFQYKFAFETDNATYTPKLFNTTVGYTVTEGVAETSLSSAAPITDNNFHYVAVTFDNDTAANNFNMYIDGVLNNSKTDHNTSGFIDNDLYVGRNYQGTTYFDGTLDEFRIYNYSLTPEQINNNYLLNYNTIISNETTRTESYICSITPNDGEEDGTTLNSTSLIIRNQPPTVFSLLNPINAPILGTLPELNWTFCGV